MSEAEARSLYDRIGGEPGLARLLVAFYQRVLADESLAPFFVDASIEKLQHMQREFFAAALDGPIAYRGRSLSEVHASLGIEPRDLTRFLEHLLSTLQDLGISEDERYEIYSRINRYADEITGRTTVDG